MVEISELAVPLDEVITAVTSQLVPSALGARTRTVLKARRQLSQIPREHRVGSDHVAAASSGDSSPWCRRPCLGHHSSNETVN